MYCSACGQLMQPNETACSKCGRVVPAAVQAGPPQFRGYAAMAANAMRGRVERHAHTLGILWLAYAGWLLIMWAFAATFLVAFFGMAGRPGSPFGNMGPFAEGFPFSHLPWLIPFVTVFVIVRSLLSVLTGIALLRHEPWGRTLALVTGFLTLIKPIMGTVLAIYTLWVLLPSESGLEYEQASR